MNTKNLQAIGLLSALSLLSIHAQASPKTQTIQDKSMPLGLPAEHYKGTENAETDDFGQFVFSAEGEEIQECNLPPEVLDATEETIPEGIIYEYEVDENGNYVMLDDEGNPVPIDEGFSVPMPTEDRKATEISPEMTEEGAVTAQSLDRAETKENWFTAFFTNLWRFFFGE